MGVATERKLAVIGPHDTQTVRALPTVIEALRRHRPPTLGDGVTVSFFAEGARQEATGVYAETEHVPIPSLDRVARRRWPVALALVVLLAAGAIGAWWLGIRPPAEWQRSQLWQRLHLPQTR